MTCVSNVCRGVACAYTLAQWSILLEGAEEEKLNQVVANMESLVHDPPLLLWPEPG
jgi:hypothetical protein